MVNKKACIIGCGSIFPVHAQALAKMPEVTLAAVADIRSERAEAAGNTYGCKAYTDWKEMLLGERPDTVHICTPHYLHAPMAIFALQHGINVLTEKPVALNVKEAQTVVAARDASQKTAAVVFQNRLNETTLAAKEILDSGAYGKLTGIKGLVTWHRDDAYYRDSGWRGQFSTEGGGVLINQSIHTLDLLYYFAGEPEKIRALTGNFAHEGVIEVEDNAVATLFFKNGVRGVFFATTANMTDSPVEIELILERAKIVIRDGKAFLYKDQKETELCAAKKAGGPQKECWGDSHFKLIERFYRNLDGATPFVTLEEGMYSLRMIDAIYRSSKTGTAAEF